LTCEDVCVDRNERGETVAPSAVGTVATIAQW
jgi:hypothetical protein